MELLPFLLRTSAALSNFGEWVSQCTVRATYNSIIDLY